MDDIFPFCFALVGKRIYIWGGRLLMVIIRFRSSRWHHEGGFYAPSVSGDLGKVSRVS